MIELAPSESPVKVVEVVEPIKEESKKESKIQGNDIKRDSLVK